ncbi:hypothetical protein ACFQE1_03690 [Halobium palmae]|uniref:DUF7344 domain-containing protein n=1 Tax=Halobium palmae TaxID=1776492 RepID=A0ABD5RW07_9EURY
MQATAYDYGVAADACQVLSNPVRIHIIAVLSGTQRSFSVKELADSVADVFGGGSKQNQVTLHHSHLPVLREEGVIDYDSDAEMVARGPRFLAFAQLQYPVTVWGADNEGFDWNERESYGW